MNIGSKVRIAARKLFIGYEQKAKARAGTLTFAVKNLLRWLRFDFGCYVTVFVNRNSDGSALQIADDFYHPVYLSWFRTETPGVLITPGVFLSTHSE